MGRTILPNVVAPEQLAGALATEPGLRLLDVRTEAEFARQRIAGSHNVPLAELEAHAREIGAVQAPVVLVCRSGARARTAEALLRRAGMRKLHLLEGGVLGWRSRGLPVAGEPLSAGALLRRAAGFVGLVLAAFNLRTNLGLALVLGVVGLRLALGQSVLPCAAAGTCAAPGPDTRTRVRAFVEGRAPEPAVTEGAERRVANG